MQRIKAFFKRPSTIAFIALTALYAACMGYIFWGTWALDRAPVEPDNATFYPINEAAQWFHALVSGHDFIPSDLMHVLGGMYFWQELQYALAGYLAALGLMFYLRGRGLSHVAAAAGGGAYGLMGYTFTLFSAGHLGWFIWMMYGPFAFGLVDRAVRKGKWRNWALLGAVLAWAAARQPDMWLLFTVLTFAYGVWTLVREWKKVKFVRILAGVGVTAVVACAIGLPQFTRALTQDVAGREAQIAEASGKGGDATVDKSADERWRFCTSWSLPPEDTLEFVVAEVHGGSSDPRVSPANPYRGRLGKQVVVPPEADGQRNSATGEILKAGETIWMSYRQHSLYFGLITVVFAILGVVGWWRRRKDGSGLWRDVPFWFGAAILMYLCALGCFTPFYRLVYALPFGGTLRAPVKFVHLLEFCVAALAGFGFEAAWRGFRQERAAPFGVKAVLVALAAANVVNLAYVDGKYCAVEDVSLQKASNDVANDVDRLGGGKVFVAAAPDLQMQIWMHLQQSIQRLFAQINVPLDFKKPQSVQNFIQSVNAKLPLVFADERLRPDDKKWIRSNLKPMVSLSKDVNCPLLSLNDQPQMMKKILKMKAVQDSLGTHLVETTASFDDARFCFLPKWLHEANDVVRWIPGKQTPVGFYSLQQDGIRASAPDACAFVLLQREDVPAPPPKEEPKPDRGRQILILISVLATFGVLVWGVCGAITRRKGVKA